MLAVLPEADMVNGGVNKQTAKLSSIICSLYMEHVPSGLGSNSGNAVKELLETNSEMFLTGQDSQLC